MNKFKKIAFQIMLGFVPAVILTLGIGFVLGLWQWKEGVGMTIIVN